jgi:hypothetical protein
MTLDSMGRSFGGSPAVAMRYNNIISRNRLHSREGDRRLPMILRLDVDGSVSNGRHVLGPAGVELEGYRDVQHLGEHMVCVSSEAFKILDCQV